FYKRIPKNVYADGKIDIKIRRISGDFAVLSGIFIREFIDKTEGGPQSAYTSKPSRKLFLHTQSLFKGETEIYYQLPEPSYIELSFYDASGRKIRILEKGERGAGFYSVKWDGKGDDGKELTSGVYFIVLKTENGVLKNKLILEK
ncbi:MAG: FlgD immunoglobulin-like domain containing protein, partial [candidate division WOR-3 bacterium]